VSVEINLQFKKGQSHSLRAGLSKVKDDFPAVMFLLGDQPMLNTATINILLERFWTDDKDICVPIYRGKRKTPAIFSRRFYTQLMDIKGDTGARQLIDDNPDRVLAVEMDNPICFFDIDTQQDFESLKKQLEKSK
jgi:molybdenum cofactor cytidylyltransferase